ncbi:MAG TPA: carboxypeptidase regulatory-like domain-containing protein [Terriglobales bacterium]|nr:carboxypeptidase regulatory-like domain-containing protein [Terriglobales bacterium]
MKASWLLATLFSASVLLVAQTQTSQVSGLVLDPAGAAIPGAAVSIVNTGTGLARSAQSGANGAYTLTNLPPGNYTLRVAKAGFDTFVQSGIVLQVNTNPSINANLRLGASTQEVRVRADAAQVETHTNSIGQVIGEQSVVDLPLNGRQITQLVTLSGAAVAAVPISAAQALTSNKDYPSASSFSVAGGQGGQTLFVLDGAPHMDPISNVGLPMPFPDALQEFRLETSALPANYGEEPGGVVNVVTKSGGNQFHGDLFEFVRNYAFNARNFFAPTRDSLKRNQFGGTLGGPIVKDKLFFFAGYQGTFEGTAPAQNIAYVATPATLAGDFTQIASPTCNNGRQITLKAPFVNNQVNPNLLNAVALKELALLPTSSDACGRTSFAIPSSDHENQVDGRVDWDKSASHTLFARYFVTDFAHAPYYQNDLLTVSTDASVGLADRVQSLVLGDTYIFSPTLISSARVSFSRSAIRRYVPTTYPTLASLGAGVTPQVANYQFTSVSGYFTVACANCNPGPWISNDFQASEDLTWIHGNHQVEFGANWMHSQLNGFGTFQANGDLFFSGQVSGNALADFELGNPSLLLQSNGQVLHDRINAPSLYIQDNFRLTPRLTINAGLRWDPYLLPYNADHQASIFDPGWFAAGVHSQRFTNAPQGTLFYGDAGMPGASYGFGKVANFAPRLGLIFDPQGKGKETIRAGFGIFYAGTPLFMQVGTHAPWASPITLPQPAGGLSNPWASYPGGNPFPTPAPTAGINFPIFGGGLGAFPLHAQPPYIEQWNLSFQRQVAGNWLLSANYLGNRSVHLELGNLVNSSIYVPGTCSAGVYGLTKPGPCSTAGNENYRRALILSNPAQGKYYGAETLFGSGGYATYNALLLSAQHAFANRFELLANYTWSHCLDNTEIALNGAGVPQDPSNPGLDYGNCLSNLNQVFNLSMVAQAPRFASSTLRALLGNWRLAPIVTAQSGPYSTVVTGTDTSLTGVATRPNQVADPGLANPTVAHWFNTAAFAPPGPGQYGNVGRGTILGPSTWDMDAALSRLFPLAESRQLELRVEAFNVWNHARFAPPVTAMNAPNFGQIAAAGDPRILQFAVKFLF